MVRFSQITIFVFTVCLLFPSVGWSGKSKLSANHQVSQNTGSAAGKRRIKRSRKKRRRKATTRTRRRFYPLKAGAGYRLQDQHRAWGTFTAVMTLQDALGQHHSRYPEAPDLVIHDLSRRRGGKLAPHLSHRSGRDVDIRLPLTPHRDRYVAARPSTLNVERTWFLISALLQSRTVEYIFIDKKLQRVLYRHARDKGFKRAELRELFQYPGRHRKGVIRHEPGHKGHMHVRFLRKRPPAQELVL